MKEYFEIKRKNFEIIEKISDRSYKVTRKGKIYFLKDFEDDTSGFEKFVTCENRLSITGISYPKIYAYDKKTHVIVTEFIEGQLITDLLILGDLKEEIIDEVFKANWYMRNAKIAINFNPSLWMYTGSKLVYLGHDFKKFESKDSFEKMYLRYWFYTKDFISYLNSLGIQGDSSRIGPSEAAVNKKMALMVVKYYR